MGDQHHIEVARRRVLLAILPHANRQARQNGYPNDCPPKHTHGMNGDPAGIIGWLRQEGFTHVLADWGEIRRLATTYGFYSALAPEVFTRLVSAENSRSGGGQAHWYGWGDFKPLIHPRTLDRVDWYHNNHDDYGRLNQAREAADDAIRALAARGTANSHEIMLRREVPRSDVLMFAVSSDSARDQALRLFREAGITTYHGFPVADMVVRMDTPSDFSRFKRDNPIHAFLAGWSDDLPASVEAGLDP